MMNENSRSKKLLDKVYDHLESIDVTKLSWDELKDYLEVVQKGRFLESLGAISPLSPNPYGFGFNQPVCGARDDTTRDENKLESRFE